MAYKCTSDSFSQDNLKTIKKIYFMKKDIADLKKSRLLNSDVPRTGATLECQ